MEKKESKKEMRKYLSARRPNTIAPTNTPAMNTDWALCRRSCRLHTRSHCKREKARSQGRFQSRSFSLHGLFNESRSFTVPRQRV